LLQTPIHVGGFGVSESLRDPALLFQRSFLNLNSMGQAADGMPAKVTPELDRQGFRHGSIGGV